MNFYTMVNHPNSKQNDLTTIQEGIIAFEIMNHQIAIQLYLKFFKTNIDNIFAHT